MNLKGKTALVTGGARGIGKAIALKLARQGANVAILDMAVAPDTVKEIEALGVKSISLEANVTKLESVEQAVEIQSQYAKKAYDTYIAEMSKIGEMYAGLARDAYKPVETALTKKVS